ncbi:putative kinesin-related protein bimC [Neurospora crassa]|nr:putative kinesin-related protein bimC [Neurospora crassa]
MERKKPSSMSRPPSVAGTRSNTSMRPPPTRNTASSTGRQSALRNASAPGGSRAERSGAASPADSQVSATAGAKRKERDFDPEDEGTTNINVVVRCRGRNDREVKENSAVVVKTEGLKGRIVELSMGPNAVSNKTYTFDRVFSQAADQAMVFDEVVKPILEEMLAGYNCTIFAYGQTGTGKTYTMSGDMNQTFGMLPDTAGIIPRVLHALFNKLEVDDKEHCVRCSFIELYNEELRDLLSAEDNTKLKIFDDNSKKGHATTIVQGMEERHILSAADGLRWLQEGSVRRQVAATKCNDLSSRSHTVFTITVHVKQQTENGEDYLMGGKLNLVDLAGSENIQRSGAENKRAAEAGLINKSLLTLGRVINALVDRSPHIPYRESKLTRLLQDSLGGRTKTCIIATISPARSNMEETISTLDYAFRAKNIRNKPQINALLNKKTLLREFATEIEKLKSELIATRQRNGVYLSNDAYEELTVQNESRRILTEEQAARIETLETNLRNKLQELYTMTSTFMGLRKEHEATKAQLDETKDVLDQTELVLAATRKSLAEEAHLRRAHQTTEQKLAKVGDELISTVKRTVQDVEGLHAKNRRRSDLHALNRSTWAMSQSQVTGITELVESRIAEFRKGQEEHISSVSERMQSFVQEELDKLSTTQAFLDQNLEHFAESRTQLLEQKQKSKEEMDNVLEEIKVVRDTVKQRVGESLQAIASAAERIAGDVLGELTTFHSQLHASYSSLGKECKSIFGDLLQTISAQKAEAERLRQELEGASQTIVESNATVSARIQEVLEEERRQAAEERQNLLLQIGSLINSQAEMQESRLAGKTALIRQAVMDSNATFEGSMSEYLDGMNAWNEKDSRLMEDVVKSRDVLKNKMKDDWATADEHSNSIQNTTKSVHAETVRVVDAQLKDLDTQMQDLDQFVSRARSENSAHHEQHVVSMENLTSTVEKSFINIADHFGERFDRIRDLSGEMDNDAKILRESLEPLDESLRQPLAALREDIQSTKIREYEPTGDTPEKKRYEYPTDLPRTAGHETLIAGMQDKPSTTPTTSPAKRAAMTAVYSDIVVSPSRSPSKVPLSVPVSPRNNPFGTPGPTTSTRNKSHLIDPSLREVNPNLGGGTSVFGELSSSTMSMAPPSTSVIGFHATNTDHTEESATQVPLFRRSNRRQSPRVLAKKKITGHAGGIITEGLENMPVTTDASVGIAGNRRKTPRLG